jgi:hypothetical protein
VPVYNKLTEMQHSYFTPKPAEVRQSAASIELLSREGRISASKILPSQDRGLISRPRYDEMAGLALTEARS